VTAAARKIAPRPSTVEVFIARAEARALLWQAGEFSLHDAVDELQTAALRDGLVAELGQDAVQRLMVEAFAPLRDDLAFPEEGAESTEDDGAAVGDVSIATLWAAEYLVQQGDAERFRRWLDQHSTEQRMMIRRHLEAKRCHSHRGK